LARGRERLWPNSHMSAVRCAIVHCGGGATSRRQCRSCLNAVGGYRWSGR
jgi:hypothetical protein